MIQRNQSQKSFADGYPINRKNGERRYRYQYLFLRYRFFLAIYKIIHSTLVLVPAFLII